MFKPTIKHTQHMTYALLDQNYSNICIQQHCIANQLSSAQKLITVARHDKPFPLTQLYLSDIPLTSGTIILKLFASYHLLTPRFKLVVCSRQQNLHLQVNSIPNN